MNAAPKQQPRNSILLRPKVKQSRNNLETGDAQFELEQQRLAAAQKRREMRDHERMQFLSSDPTDKAATQCAAPRAPVSRAQCAHFASGPVARASGKSSRAR